MYANMAEAMKNPPEDALRKWVVETLWYKARELRCRGEGFYHWVLAAKLAEGPRLPPPQVLDAAPAPAPTGDKDKAQEELNLALAYLDREADLMKEAGEKGYPAEVAGMGYVPTGYGGAPTKNIRDWAAKNSLSVPAKAELEALFMKVDGKP